MCRFAGVAVVEGPTRRSGHVLHVAGRLHETFDAAQSAVGIEGRFEGGDQQHVEGRAVTPVVVAFGIVAVRCVDAYRVENRRARPFDDLDGLLFFLIEDGQCAKDQSGIAHLVPVVGGTEKPVVAFVARGSEAFVADRPENPFPVGGDEAVVEPVITDGYGHRHLAHIEKMGGVPVAERTDGHHLLFGTQGVTVVAGHTVGKREVKDPSKSFARDGEQTESDLLIGEGRSGQQGVAPLQNGGVDSLHFGTAGQAVTYFSLGTGSHQQARMGLPGCIIDRAGSCGQQRSQQKQQGGQQGFHDGVFGTKGRVSYLIILRVFTVIRSISVRAPVSPCLPLCWPPRGRTGRRDAPIP